MDRQDILTFIIAVMIVIVVAVVMKGPSWGMAASDRGGEYPSTVSYEDVVILEIEPAKLPPPYQIRYNTNPSSIYSAYNKGYPLYTLPPDLNIYGESDIFLIERWPDQEVRTFAFFEGNQSGFSEIFSVPYPAWRINCSIVSDTLPQYAFLKWVLVNSKTGDIITGGEIRYRGKIEKLIPISETDMYLMISADHVDEFRMNFETTSLYYNQYRIGLKNNRMIEFLDAI